MKYRALHLSLLLVRSTHMEFAWKSGGKIITMCNKLQLKDQFHMHLLRLPDTCLIINDIQCIAWLSDSYTLYRVWFLVSPAHGNHIWKYWSRKQLKTMLCNKCNTTQLTHRSYWIIEFIYVYVSLTLMANNIISRYMVPPQQQYKDIAIYTRFWHSNTPKYWKHETKYTVEARGIES